MRKDQRGMGPIEKILAGVMIAVVVVVVVAVINPRGAQSEKRNEQRETDIAELLQATEASMALEEGNEAFKPVIDDEGGTVQIIVKGADAEIDCTSYTCGLEILTRENCAVDYSVMSKDILSSVPVDPGLEEEDDSKVTGYYVNNFKGVYTVGACGPEPTKNGVVPDLKVTSGGEAGKPAIQ